MYVMGKHRTIYILYENGWFYLIGHITPSYFTTNGEGEPTLFYKEEIRLDLNSKFEFFIV